MKTLSRCIWAGNVEAEKSDAFHSDSWSLVYELLFSFWKLLESFLYPWCSNIIMDLLSFTVLGIRWDFAQIHVTEFLEVVSFL